MPLRVFYSWQSDRRQNRNFIRSVLKSAIKELREDLALEEAQRDIVLDQDTQGLPGTPAIADAILTKIRSAEAFVADLTFVDDNLNADTADDRRTPNSNVMLEYGYALHALSEARIIGLLNEAFGHPRDLPFDLAHRRWPIRFNLPDNASPGERASEHKRIAPILRDALRSIISQFGGSGAPTPQSPPFPLAAPGDGVGRLRNVIDFLCLTSAEEGKPVWLAKGPYAFLRLVPGVEMPHLGDVDAYKIAQAYLQPMDGARHSRWATGRHESGAVSYWATPDEPLKALDASQLYLSRELWANDFYHLDPTRDRVKELGFSFIPTGAIEEIFIDTLVNFVQVARNHLAIQLPVQIIAGLVAVQGFRLAVIQNNFGFNQHAGRILKNNIAFETTLREWTEDPFDLLLPLFNAIYDAAGITRPAVRTTGRRQR